MPGIFTKGGFVFARKLVGGTHVSVFILHSQDAVQEYSWCHLRPGRRGSYGRNVSAAVAFLASGPTGPTLHFHTLFTSGKFEYVMSLREVV